MTGLYIIEEFEKVIPSIYDFWVIFSFFISLIFVFCFWTKALDEGTLSILGKIYWSLAFFGCFMLIVLPLYFCNKCPTYPAYKAIITSEIDMEKFNEKYEIVDEKNDIYTIKEK